MEKEISVIVAKFNAIKTMREIRDNLSFEIMNMTFEQERAYLDDILYEKKSELK